MAKSRLSTIIDQIIDDIEIQLNADNKHVIKLDTVKERALEFITIDCNNDDSQKCAEIGFDQIVHGRLYQYGYPADKARAEREAELVSFGEAVEVADLPLAVRRWAAKRPQPRYVWNGESWQDLVGAFEKAILEQVLERAHGNISAAARLLKTTPRVISYKAKKHGVKSNGIP